jgi:hypothetical protein
MNDVPLVPCQAMFRPGLRSIKGHGATTSGLRAGVGAILAARLFWLSTFIALYIGEIMIRIDKIAVFCVSILLAACAAHSPGKEIVLAQQGTGGVSLYQAYCANCHGPFARTTKPGRSTGRLRSAINQFPVMQNLDFLTDRQLQEIASALATINLQQASRSRE